MNDFRKKILRITPHLFFLLAIYAVATMPLLYRIQQASPDTVWSGGHKQIQDYYTYISYIRQGRTDLFPVNQATLEDEKPFYLHTYYTVLGKTGNLLHIRSDVAMYYFGLYVPLFFYYLVIYRILTIYFRGRLVWLGMFLIFFSSPPPKDIILFGHTVFSPKNYSWVAGIFNWGLDAYQRMTPKPHHLFGTVCVLSAFYFLLKLEKNRKSIRYAVFTAVCVVLGTFFFLPPMLFLMITLCTTYSLLYLQYAFRQKLLIPVRMFATHLSYIFRLLFILLLFLCTLVVVKQIADGGTMLVQGGQRLNITQWEIQTYSYKGRSVWELILIYTLPYIQFFPFIPFALWQIRKYLNFRNVLLVMMAVCPFLLSFPIAKEIIPFPYIRMFFQTTYIAVAILSMFAFAFFKNKLSKVTNTLLFYLSLIYFSWISVTGLIDYWIPEFKNTYFHINGYIPKEYFPVFEYLNSNTPKYSRVMNMYNTGMLLIAFSHNKTYIAHDIATEEFSKKIKQHINFFYCRMSSEDSIQFLRNNAISYVVWDKGGNCNQYNGFLKVEFQSENVYVNKVLP